MDEIRTHAELYEIIAVETSNQTRKIQVEKSRKFSKGNESNQHIAVGIIAFRGITTIEAEEANASSLICGVAPRRQGKCLNNLRHLPQIADATVFCQLSGLSYE